MSKSKQAARKEDLLFSNEILAHMAEGLSLVKVDDFSIVYANSKFEKMFGYDPGEIIGKNVSILNAPTEKNLEEIVAEIYIAFANDKAWYGEIENIKKDGTPFWSMASVSIFDHSYYGKVFVSINTDITKHKKADLELKDASNFNQPILNVCPVGFLVFKESGPCVMANLAAENIVGASHEQMLKLNFREMETYKKTGILDDMEAALITGDVIKKEIRTTNTFGKKVWFEGVISVFERKGEKHILYMFHDILERKLAEDELQKNKDLHEKTQALGHIGTWHLNISEGLQAWTDENCRIFGVPPGSGATSELFWEKIHPEDLDYVVREWIAAVQGKPYDIEHRIVVNGETRWVRGKAELIFDDQGHAISATGFTQDITEDKKTRESLAQVAKEWQATFDATNDAMWILDSDNRILRSNRAAETMFHCSPEEMIGNSCCSIVHQTEDRHPDCPFEKSQKSRRRETIELQDKGRWLRVTVDPIFDANGQYSGAVHIVSDITESKQGEDQLKKSEERFRVLVENAPDAIFVRDRECFTYLNSAALTLFGARAEEDLVGTPIIERYHPKVRDNIRERMHIINDLHMPAPLFQSVCLQLDGTEVDVESTAVPINFQGKSGALIFMRNITDRIEEHKRRQHLEEQLHQAQKIESLGRLAGGVSHDYNNMLTVIIGNVELAKIKAERSAPLNDNLEQIFQAANKSKQITHQLLAFARKQIINPKVLDLNDAVENTLKMLHTLLGENIDLIWQPKGGLWPVKIDPSQLDQVLANLCINARDAITDIGKMTIESANVSFDEDYCKDHPGFIFGDYVVLSVSDNGCGMDKETLDNVFEPFFTTKQIGEGTGLGMSTVYGIVKQSGGFIYAYSEPNLGTTFKIYFPRYKGEDEVSQETTLGEIQKGQGETVLLVEDEVAIVELTTAMLEDFGYRVLAANSPVAALNLLKESRGDIQLLLTDVVMPGMNGRELAKQVREIHPEMKTLYMSGYTADVIAHHGVLDDDIYFIQKPFSRRDLSIRVREILDSNS